MVKEELLRHAIEKAVGEALLMGQQVGIKMILEETLFKCVLN
jgi:hypothetical protein